MKILLSFLLMTSFFISTGFNKAEANVGKFFKRSGAILLGSTLGTVVAVPRGFVKGAFVGKDLVTKGLNNSDSLSKQAVGFLSGGVIGAPAGAIAGLCSGIYDGIYYGYNDPFSAQNFSAGGKNILDYDVFNKT